MKTSRRRRRPVRRAVVPLAAAALLAGIASAPLPQSATPADGVVTLPPVNPAALQDAIAGLPTPDITAAVVGVTGRGGHWAGASGPADLSTQRAASPVDRFRIGSVTKLFTAAVVLQLVAEHRVGLDVAVQHYLPGILPAAYPTITVAQLLDHTSGLPRTAGAGDGEGDPAQFVQQRFGHPSPREVIGDLDGQPLVFAPGSALQYNGINYFLLGLVIEKAGGRPYAEQVDERILRPLRLADTRVPAATDYRIPGPHLHGYLAVDVPSGSSRLVDVTEQSPYPWAEVGMTSSVGDLGRFWTALLAGRLLPPAQLQQMLTVPDVPYLGTDHCRLGPPGRACFGLGPERDVAGGVTLWGKTGSRPGYTDGVFATTDLQRVIAYGFTPTGRRPDTSAFVLAIAAAALGGTPPTT